MSGVVIEGVCSKEKGNSISDACIEMKKIINDVVPGAV